MALNKEKLKRIKKTRLIDLLMSFANEFPEIKNILENEPDRELASVKKVNCDYCGKEFNKRKSSLGYHNFCSEKCFHNFAKENPDEMCKHKRHELIKNKLEKIY